jgi:hypothetical protein
MARDIGLQLLSRLGIKEKGNISVALSSEAPPVRLELTTL